MAVKLRLQRHGRKGRPYYYIVAANVTSKRDGRYIERVGSYNPVNSPATIDLDVDASLKWLRMAQNQLRRFAEFYPTRVSFIKSI